MSKTTSEAETLVDYGYGDGVPDTAGNYYGYGDQGQDCTYEKSGDDYGYGDQGNVYGYDEPSPPQPKQLAKAGRARSVRRNSCLVRKDGNNLAVAEFLVGGPPRMSDRDLAAGEKTQVTV